MRGAPGGMVVRPRHLVLVAFVVLTCISILWVSLSGSHQQPTSSSTLMSIPSRTLQGADASGLVFPVREEISRIRIRDDFGDYLEELGYKTGAELGVQDGWFVKETLPRWKSCTQYILVDIWRQQSNYIDAANRPNNVQEAMYQKLMDELRTRGWAEKIKVMRMLTKEAANEIPDESLDYVYVDARHDYCGCKEDLDRWWPKLRPGGMLAGHDYLTAAEAKVHLQSMGAPENDWAICENGQRYEGAVKSAVQDFAKYHGIPTVYVIPQQFKTWYFQKPK